MVKNYFFARMGVVKFVRGWQRRRRFVKMLKRCDQLNKTSKSKHIVICFSQEPAIINKPTFKRMRREGVFNNSSSWGKMCAVRVTPENLDTFFTTSKTKTNVSNG